MRQILRLLCSCVFWLWGMLLPVLPLSAQVVDSLFLRAPMSVLPLLPELSRLDMLDYYHCGQVAQAENAYGGRSRLLQLTGNFVALQLTEVSSWQLKLLPAEADTLLCCVHTVAGHSRVCFYDRQWRECRPRQVLPAASAFWKPRPDSISVLQWEDLRRPYSVATVEAALSAADNELRLAISHFGQARADSVAAAPHLRTLRLRWNGRAFAE